MCGRVNESFKLCVSACMRVYGLALNLNPMTFSGFPLLLGMRLLWDSYFNLCVIECVYELELILSPMAF